MSYRIDVVTDSVSEAVRHAGGLMFDCRRAGWKVVVITDDAADSRALDILGVDVESPGGAENRIPELERENRTVLSAISAATAAQKRGSLLGLRNQRLVWGQPVDSGWTSFRHPAPHALSPAARMFKAQALYSAGLTSSVEDREHFWADSETRAGSRAPMVVGR
ncbi:hypothetical protein AB0K11_26945 [Mycobacterium sp. NPDC050551]|uniref:hypothetical protein n=1 Tax=Mycobacterium sp. NPDC050551 TaxID=3155407 RepID=UPI00343C265A